MRRRVPVVVAVVVVLASVSLGGTSWGLTTSPSETLDNSARFDGQVVTLTGTITNLRPRVSAKGNAYYTFDLSDGPRTIPVFSFGRSPCTTGTKATVEGTFQRVKNVGRYTFYNQIDAITVTCP